MSSRAAKLAVLAVPAIIAVVGLGYLAVVADEGLPTPKEPDTHAEWLLEVEGTATPTPTPVPTPVPTPQPTPVPPPPELPAEPVEPEPDQAYVYVPPAPPPPPPPRPPPAPPPDPARHRPDWAQTILALINQRRATAGLGAVTYDGSLQASADYYVEFHSRNGDVFNLNHWLDGGPGDRAWARGYCCAVAEVLATAEGSAQQIFDLWMGSPGHASVIVDGAMDHVGVSCFQAPYSSATRGVIYPVMCAAEFGNSN